MHQRSIIVIGASILGMLLAAYITGLKNLTLLENRGQTITGTVVGNEPAARGRIAHIRIILAGRTVVLSEPCLGFDCDGGEQVNVRVLPDDASVHAAGDFEYQLWTAAIATLLIAPTLFGGGTAFSLWAVNRNARTARAVQVARVPFRLSNLPGLRYFPLVATLGVLVSTALGLIEGPGANFLRFQISATVCLIAGSIVYLFLIRQANGPRKALIALCVVFFSLGVGLIVIGISASIRNAQLANSVVPAFN